MNDDLFIRALASGLRQCATAEDLKPDDLLPGGWFERMAIESLTTAFNAGKIREQLSSPSTSH